MADTIEDEARRLAARLIGASRLQIENVWLPLLVEVLKAGMRREREACLSAIHNDQGTSLVYQSIQLGDHHPGGDPLGGASDGKPKE